MGKDLPKLQKPVRVGADVEAIRLQPLFPHPASSGFVEEDAPSTWKGPWEEAINAVGKMSFFKAALIALQMVTAAMKLKDPYSLEGKL